ncbi:MAG: hypothetical protein E2O77_13075, partial [Caldithrix sp.]
MSVVDYGRTAFSITQYTKPNSEGELKVAGKKCHANPPRSERPQHLTKLHNTRTDIERIIARWLRQDL